MRYLIIFSVITGLAIAGCVSNPKDETAWEPATVMDSSAVLQTGMNVSMVTFAELSKELQAAMKEGGVQQAVPYCNLKALPIADSLSELHGVLIRRVTDRTRNPADSLNEMEADVFASYRDAQAADGDMSPVVRGSADGAYYFAPILLQEFCLKCHGEPGTDIAAGDLELIQGLYPEDKATGYKPGELRGMWSIYFPQGKVPVKGDE